MKEQSAWRVGGTDAVRRGWAHLIKTILKQHLAVLSVAPKQRLLSQLTVTVALTGGDCSTRNARLVASCEARTG